MCVKEKRGTVGGRSLSVQTPEELPAVALVNTTQIPPSALHAMEGNSNMNSDSSNASGCATPQDVEGTQLESLRADSFDFSNGNSLREQHIRRGKPQQPPSWH